MTAIYGSPIGPDGVGGEYKNPLDDRRAQIWYGAGGRQAVLKGFVASQVPGMMQLSFTAGAALLAERDGSGNLLNRGYLARADTATVVTFGAASASNRNDAVVVAVVDVEDGVVGTGALAVGAHIVVVPGVSGTTTPRADADITAYLGRGGWMRLLDVPVASGSTQINVGTMDDHTGGIRNALPVTQVGRATVTVGASMSAASTAVTFAVAFATAPTVTVTAQTSAPTTYMASCQSASTTGVTIWGQKTTTGGATSFNVDWIAVGYV